VIEDDDGVAQGLRAGQRVRVTAEIDTELVPGRYSILCSISRTGSPGNDAIHDVRIAEFLVKGSNPMPGMIFVRARVDATVESGADAR